MLCSYWPTLLSPSRIWLSVLWSTMVWATINLSKGANRMWKNLGVLCTANELLLVWLSWANVSLLSEHCVRPRPPEGRRAYRHHLLCTPLLLTFTAPTIEQIECQPVCSCRERQSMQVIKVLRDIWWSVPIFRGHRLTDTSLMNLVKPLTWAQYILCVT